MRQKRWTKAGRDFFEQNPNAFSGRVAPSHHFKGGAHARDVDYKRSDKKADERRAKRGEFED